MRRKRGVLLGIVAASLAAGVYVGVFRDRGADGRVVMLPPLPAQGLAVGRAGGIDLIAADGTKQASVPDISPSSPYSSDIFAGAGKGYWFLEVRRHLLVHPQPKGYGWTSSDLIGGGQDGLPPDCFRIIVAFGTVFGYCDDPHTRLVAQRGGRTSVLLRTAGGWFGTFELGPDGHTVVAPEIHGDGARACGVSSVVLDTRRSTARVVTGAPLGFLRSSELVLFARPCSGGEGRIVVLGPRGARVVARHAESASGLWGDAGRTLPRR